MFESPTVRWLGERIVVSAGLCAIAWAARFCWRLMRASQRDALGDPLTTRRGWARAYRASRHECQALLLPTTRQV
tara:strand:- start:2635 stop:2859 length:225 start_codon:yes stop_codon:yes gene_type:complete